MEPTDLTVEQVAAALKSREMTAEAYAESLLARAAAHADLNAFISQDPDAVRGAARAADKSRAAGGAQGPLAAFRWRSRTTSTRPRLGRRAAARG